SGYGNVPASTFSNFEYTIPTNAEGNLNSSHIVLDGSETITIPAGTYDFCICNPLPGDAMWIIGGEWGVKNDYLFEDGKTYHFLITHDATQDYAIVTIANTSGGTITASADTLNFGGVVLNNSATLSVNISLFGTNSASATTAAPFSISLDGNNFSTQVSHIQHGDNLIVKYTPTTDGSIDNSTVLLTADTLSATIVLTGLGVDCEHTSLPFFENCDYFSPCWQYYNESTSNTNEIGPINNEGYGNIFHFSSMLPANNFNQYLISPLLTSTGPIIFKFDYWDTDLGREQFQVGYSTTNDNPTSFNWETQTTSSASVQNYETVLPANTKFVAIKYLSNDMFYLYLDNFSIQVIPTEPTITASQENLNFGTVGVGTARTLALPIRAYSLTDDISINANAPFSVSTDNLNFGSIATLAHNNLVTEDTLYVRFQPTTSGSSNSTITLSSANATDLQIAVSGTGVECQTINQLPWNEDFEGATFPPICWEIVSETPNYTWSPYTYGSTWASCKGLEDDRTERLITPNFDLSQFTDSLTLAFDFISFYAYIEHEYVDLKIYASTDGGNTFTDEPIWTLSDFGVFTDQQSTHATMDVSSLAGQSNVKFAFSYEGAVCQVLIDNVNLYHGASPVSVAEFDGLQASIFPNPARDILHIQTAASISRIEVFNLAGQHIATHGANDNNIQLSTSAWVPGIYLLKIHTTEGIVNRKVVIAR
ncbi:MAG: DUF2436 domain-containing protein, partial [Bacteroidales bacterium]|nr:DUF2436 domain-containing protein [Bacteroidales bacterium]